MGGFIRLNQEHLTSIGKVTVYFGILESILTQFIWALKHDTKVVDHRFAQIITAELSFKAKISLLSSLYFNLARVPGFSLPAQNECTILFLFSSASATLLSISFNLGGSSRAPDMCWYTARRGTGLKVDFEQITVQEVDKIADFIDDVALDLSRFMGQDQLHSRYWKMMSIG